MDAFSHYRTNSDLIPIISTWWIIIREPLYRIINDLCNGGGKTLNSALTLMYAVYNLHYVSGNDYIGLSEYLDAFLNLGDAATKAGWSAADDLHRDLMIADLCKNGNTHIELFTKLKTWQDAMAVGVTISDATLKDIKAGKDALNKRYLAGLYVQRAGKRFANYRRKQNNSYAVGNDNYAHDVTQAYHDGAMATIVYPEE